MPTRSLRFLDSATGTASAPISVGTRTSRVRSSSGAAGEHASGFVPTSRHGDRRARHARNSTPRSAGFMTRRSQAQILPRHWEEISAQSEVVLSSGRSPEIALGASSRIGTGAAPRARSRGAATTCGQPRSGLAVRAGGPFRWRCAGACPRTPRRSGTCTPQGDGGSARPPTGGRRRCLHGERPRP